MLRFILFATACVCIVKAGVVPVAPLAPAGPFVAPAGPFVAPAPLAAAAYPAGVAYAPYAIKAVKPEFEDVHPQYQYAYQVQDALTGDSKGQIESRDGDIVRGSYTLVEPDGVRRTVNYYADPINGFNAVVQRQLPLAVAGPVAAAPVVFK